MTVSKHFTDTMPMKQDSRGLIRQNETSSEKYANSSKCYMDDTDFFSTETNAVPISLRLFAIYLRLLNCLYRKQLEKYSAKRDRVFRLRVDQTLRGSLSYDTKINLLTPCSLERFS